MRTNLRALSCAFWTCAPLALSVRLAAGAPQDAAGSTSFSRIKDGIDRPIARQLTPSTPVPLQPIFRTRTEKHPFVPTLEEELHKTFDLTDFQRQYAEYASRSGIDLGALLSRLDKAWDEHKVAQARKQVARELAELEAGRRAAAVK